MRKFTAPVLALTFAAAALAGCSASGNSEDKKNGLNPDKPVSLTVWHYYNGAQQATFDALVKEFNATVGKEKGIYVEGASRGSVNDLEKAVRSAIDGEVGAGTLPDIFSCYADTAYYAQTQDKLTDLSQYFSEDEVNAFVDSYIQEGYLNQDGALYLLPVAKSTEIMMINKTDWEPFAEATKTTTDELSTVEGVVKVAERYYEWTDSQTPDVPDDGKAFYGRDSMSNYFIIGMKQMGTELFDVKDGEVAFNTNEGQLRRLWENYYVPYMKGYFASYGKFRSDDVKTGDILAYTGSTSSALYFPDHVEREDTSYPIDFIVLNPPLMEGGENVKVQQGAGMVVTKSDESREYGASIFLKWFTAKEQNLRFVCNSAYMPVLKEANSLTALDEIIKEQQIDINPKAYGCLETILTNFGDTQFYTTKNFWNGYNARKVLDFNLSDRAAQDEEAMEEAVKNGASREEELARYCSDASFEDWYGDFCSALLQAAEK